MFKQSTTGTERVTRAQSRGFSLIEVMVTVFVLTLGLLGLAGMQGRALTAENEAYQRAQAGILLADMADRLSANRLTAPCFAAVQSSGTGVKVQNFGTGVSTLTLCTGLSVDAAVMSSADLVMQGWHDQLLGTAVTGSGNANVGGILNARGCVSQHSSDANLYYIAVAWQGFVETVVPAAPAGADAGLVSAVACGSGSYGSSDALRRVVWTSARIAHLN